MSVSTVSRPLTRRRSTRTVTVTLRLRWDPDRTSDLPIPEDPRQLVNLIGLLVSRGVDVTTDADPIPGHPLDQNSTSHLVGGGERALARSLDQLPDRPTWGRAVRIDPRRRIVLRGTEPVALTRIEFDLLHFLAEHRRQVFTRQQLLNAVWRTTYASTRTVDVHIRRLRAKLGQDRPLMITVRGVGYRLHDDADLVIVHDE